MGVRKKVKAYTFRWCAVARTYAMVPMGTYALSTVAPARPTRS